MNRDIFRKGIESGVCFSESERRFIISESVRQQEHNEKCTVVMEELAELIQQISKQIRGNGDEYGLLEETADVYICLEFLKLLFKIDHDMLQKAIDVKLARELDRLGK